MGPLPRRFELVRVVDHSGTSGTGVVAYGVQFTDGVTAMHWIGATASTCVYGSVDELVAIHGHHGDSYVRWLDHPVGGPLVLGEVKP